MLTLLFQGIICASAQVPYDFDYAYDDDSNPSNVLIFHSYYPTYEWSSDISAGVLDSFSNSEYHDSEIYFEYMDAKRHSSPEYFASLAEVYKYKYKDAEKFDIIICSDNYAIDFLCSEAGLAIFPSEIPVVFCGANDYDPAWLEGRPNMTGIIEHIEPAKTLDFILKVHPDTSNLLVVNDHHTHTAQIVRAQAEEAFAPYGDKLHITYLEDMSASEMQDTVANVSDDTVIFLLLFNRDSEGKEVTMGESIEMINEVTKVPVYSAWDFYLGKGIVGGKLTSARNEGKLAGEIAINVLGGADPADIPIMDSQYHDFLFDWDQLERFSISEGELPDENILINHQLSFYELYQKEIIVTSVVIFILIIMVLLLLVNRHTLKLTQAELLAAKESAEKSDHLKSAFLANMSHELRTPLNGIIGFAQMLKVPTVSDEKKQHYADIIMKSGNQLLHLINDILDVSKIEAGEISIYKKSFDANHLLDELYSVFHAQMSLDNRPVELKLMKGLNNNRSIIFNDRDRVRQILTNLLGNAIKFTHEGSIVFGCELLDDNILEFYIKDTGIGIPEDKFDSIFGRFQQVDDSHSRKYEGTGLGMSISKGLAQLLGGDIIFESEFGVGSTFYFTLPYVQENKEQ